MDQLAKNFSRFFEIEVAATAQQIRQSFRIRHQVYSQELGWEAVNDSHLETDICDAHSYHCLLRHCRSGRYAGTVRIVVPPEDDPDAPFPYETHGVEAEPSELLVNLKKSQICEASRIAVPEMFRRKKAVATITPGEETTAKNVKLTKDEKVNLPYLSLSLYLSAVALAELKEIQVILVLTETRLQRHLHRFGMMFEQVSETIDLKGKRALYAMPRREYTCYMSPPIYQFYQAIFSSVKNQMDQIGDRLPTSLMDQTCSTIKPHSPETLAG